jgi:hypothetical protein
LYDRLYSNARACGHPQQPKTMQQPKADQVLQAVEIYLSLAYPRGVPATVRSRVEKLREAPPDRLLASDLFEKTPMQDPDHYRLRLGNEMYPHMKLTIDRRPDRRGFLFRADTHDRHIVPPPGSPEEQAFQEMQSRNHRLAQAIEKAWTQQGLPTFKSYLREDLARRQRSG